MSVRKYSLKFTKLSKYVLFMVADLRARKSKFISRVSELVSKECKTSMLMKEMDIFRLMNYTKQIHESANWTHIKLKLHNILSSIVILSQILT